MLKSGGAVPASQEVLEQPMQMFRQEDSCSGWTRGFCACSPTEQCGSVVGAMEIAHCGIAEGRKTFSFSEEKEEMFVCLWFFRQSSFELASSYDSAFQLIQMFF